MNESDHAIPVLIAIGANLGTPENKIFEAFEKLDAKSLSPSKCSSLWKTEPVDCPPGSPSYLNAAISIWAQKDTDPEIYLNELLELESQLGRTRSGTTNEPRIIDLDIVSMGQLTFSSSNLTLPHPRAHLRKFVLAPLAEIEPQFTLPGFNKTVLQLLNSISDNSKCIRWRPPSLPAS